MQECARDVINGLRKKLSNYEREQRQRQFIHLPNDGSELATSTSLSSNERMLKESQVEYCNEDIYIRIIP
ncbi:hypothetical protein LINPERPRIM_LOCUS3928, partial [Linum perenne]